MPPLFPVHELEPTVADSAFPQVAFPATDPKRFSLSAACSLIDLCVKAESSSEPFQLMEQEQDMLVAFRSSGDPAALLNVRSQTPVAALPWAGGHAYGPIVNAYRESIANKIANLRTNKRLWLTGHGIGAAFALLAAAELNKTQPVAAVYTFGAPRVVDNHLVRNFPCPVYRTVNNLDVVVTMPAAWKWRHVGAHKLINADGTLNSNPNPLNRLPSLSRQTVWLGQMMGQGLESGFPRALYTLLGQVLGDHAIASYQNRLHKLCQVP